MGRPKKEESQKGLSAIDDAINDIKKSFGEEVVINTDEIRKIPRVQLESPTLGYILGDGGCPRGRILEIYGPESSGKSLLSQFIGANFQRDGLFVAYIDTEHSFDPYYASVIGLQTTPDKFKLFQPDCGEDAFSIAEKMAETGEVGLVVMDSIAAMTPKAELEGEMTDQQMGAQARMMGKGLRKISGIVSKTNTTVIFINQIRSAIGIVYGNPTVTPGGAAIKFFASIRLEVRKAETMDGKDDEDATGIISRVKCIKNKTSIPFRKGLMTFNFTNGVDFYKEYVDFGVTFGFVKKGGAWITYEDQRFQGSAKFIKALKENEELYKTLKEKVDSTLSKDPSQRVELLPEETDEIDYDAGQEVTI